mgnify:CR=1 FL=1
MKVLLLVDTSYECINKDGHHYTTQYISHIYIEYDQIIDILQHQLNMNITIYNAIKMEETGDL